MGRLTTAIFACLLVPIFMNLIPPGREPPPGVVAAQPYLKEFTAASPLARVARSSPPYC